MEARIRKTYIAISLLLFVASILLYDVHPMVQKEFEEDRLVENVTAGMFFITFLYSLLFLITNTVERYKKTLILVMLLGLVGFLDELSFGQRIFDLNVPTVLGIPLDAVHDIYTIALVAVKIYPYIFVSIFVLIGFLSVYILVHKGITLNGVIKSILSEAPYFYFAFFVVYLSISIISEQAFDRKLYRMYLELHIFEEVLEMNSALALLSCCLSISYTRNRLLAALALVGGTVLGTVYLPDQGATWSVYQVNGRRAYLQADFAEAAVQYEAAVKEAEGFGPQDRRLATSLNNLVGVHSAEGKYADAEPLLERALAINEKALGAGHPRVAQTLNNLALLYEAQGKYADTESLLERALAISENALGAGHPRVAKRLTSLALIYQAQGKHAEAEPLFKRALSIVGKALGLEHPLVAQSLENYAVLLRETGRDAEAAEMAARAKVIRTRHAKDNR